MPSVQLANLDARLAYLALQYHLARPGAELDRGTGQPATESLSAVADALETQLDRAVVTIELSDGQRQRLISAVAGAINALKSAGLLAAGGRSGPPAFDAALRRLFPEAVDDPDEIERLAGHLLGLRRRLQSLPSEPPASGDSKRSGWRFWRS